MNQSQASPEREAACPSDEDGSNVSTVIFEDVDPEDVDSDLSEATKDDDADGSMAPL